MMRDHNGNVVVYIGQPWCNPEGTLTGSSSERLVIQISLTENAFVDRKGFVIANITYKEYKKWRENYHGVPKKKEESFNRFEIMDLEE